MANRFRMAVKNAGDEIISVGKQNEKVLNSVDTIDDDIEVMETFSAKEIEREFKDFFPKEEVILPNSNKNTNDNSVSDFSRISAFLKEKVSNEIYELRLNKLKEIMDSLILQEQTQKPIIIIDDKNNILLWMEAIKNGIPEKLKHIITFSTYENENISGYRNCIIFNNLVLPEVKRPFGKSILNFEVFDFSKISNVSVNAGSKYSEFMQVGYLLNDNRFHEFKVFFDEFNYKNLDQNLDKCLMLFYYTITGIKTLNYNSVTDALNFAERYGNPRIYNNLFKKMNFNVNMEEEMAFINIKFMLKISKLLQEKNYYSKSYRFVFDYLQKLLIKNTEHDLEHIFELFNKIYNLEENNAKDLINYGLDIQTMDKLSNYIIGENTNFAVFYLTIILKVLADRGNKWDDNSPYIEFIDMAMNTLLNDFKAIEKIINSVSKNLEYKANLILLYYKKVENNEAKRKLILQLISQEQLKNKQIINFITESDIGARLVLNEFKNNLSKSLNKVEYFWDYKSQVFDKNSKFRGECFSEIVDFYLKNIRKDSIYNDECTKILNMVSHNQIEVDDEVLIYLINDYENEVPLVGPDIITQINLKDIARIKKDRNIVTTNVNFLMMEYGKNIEKARSKREFNDLINNQIPNLRNISDIKLEEFFKWCLDLYLNNNATDPADIVSFYNKVIKVRENRGSIFIESIFSYDKFVDLKNSLDTFESKKIQFYLIITLDHFIKESKSWNKTGIHEDFIKNCIRVLCVNKEMLEYFLEATVEHTKYFSEMLSIYSNNKVSNAVALEFFIKNSKIRGEHWSDEIKVSVDKWLNGEDFLFEEFKLRYDLAINKSEFFWMYLNEAQRKVPRFKFKKISELLSIYMNTLKEKDFNGEEYIKVLNYLFENNILVNKVSFTNFIIKFENNININSLNTNLAVLVDRIIKYKRNNDVRTVPDIIGIVGFRLKLEGIISSEEMLRLIIQNSVNLVGLQRDKYIEFVDRSLSIISKKLNIVDKSNEISKAICIEEFKEDYLRLYNDLIMKQINAGTLSLSKQYFQTLISNNKNSFEMIANLIAIHFSKGLLTNEVSTSVQLFVKIVDDSKSFNRSHLEIRKYFSGLKDGNELLFHEYKYRLEGINNKSQFYAGYWNELSVGFDEYKHKFYAQALEQYLGYIKTRSNYTEACYGLLKQIKKENIQLPNDILIEIASTCEKMIVIGEQSSEGLDIIRNVSELKVQRNIVTSPDIIDYVNFGVRLHEITDLDEARRLIFNSNLDLKNIDFSRYEEWLEWCIPKVIPCANTWQSHASIKKAMCSDSLKGIFFTTYIGMLSDARGSDAFEDIFAQFIIFFINGRDHLGGETYIQGRSNISNVLSRCSSSEINDIDKLITVGCYDIRSRDIIADEWEQIKKRVSPSSRLEKGFFGKVFGK
ncbi:MAG: hypothetical protein H7Y18_12850 [Clostridiaceae bacterium]|nr:hypothetical protein [Clostridiaceae bacterium]